MKTKRLWSTIVVSFICILLASSFVLQTSAETIETVASLQGATVVDAVIPEGYDGEQADIQYVSDLGVSEFSTYTSDFDSVDFVSTSSGLGQAIFTPFSISNCYQAKFNPSSSVYYILKSSGLESVNIPRFTTTDAVYIYPEFVCLSDNYYCFRGSNNGAWFGSYLGPQFTHWYWYNGNNVSVYCCEYNDFAFFANCNADNSRVYVECWKDGVKVNTTTSMFGTLSFDTSIIPSFCSFDKYLFVRLNISDVICLDLEKKSVYKTLNVPLSDRNIGMAFFGGYLYLFGSSNTAFYRVSFDDNVFETLSYPSSVVLEISSQFNVGVVDGSLYLPANGGYFVLSSSSKHYYNMIDYSTDASFVPDRYLNFSYLSASGGTANGGGYVGFELDFGVPDYFYTNNEVTAFRFECMVGSYSNDSETFQGGIPPLTVDVVGGDNWLPILNGKMVTKVGDIYLWAFTCLVYTSNDGPITSLNITLNQYIPLQTETHSFSLPCSALTLERWEDTDDALEDIKGDIVIIGNQIGQTNEKLDEIQDILTSLPDDFNSKSEEWSSIIESGEEEESIAMSYVDEYMSFPSFDPSIEADLSNMGELLESFDNGSASDLFSFIRYLWFVHPLGLSFASVVVVIATGLVVIRMS